MEEETKLSVERQKYQMHKKGYEDIVKAISELEIKAGDVSIYMSETNKILKELSDKINEPICVKLTLN